MHTFKGMEIDRKYRVVRTARYGRILSDTVEFCQIRSDFVRYSQILSVTVGFCQIWSDFVIYGLILSGYGRILSDTV